MEGKYYSLLSLLQGLNHFSLSLSNMSVNWVPFYVFEACITFVKLTETNIFKLIVFKWGFHFNVVFEEITKKYTKEIIFFASNYKQRIDLVLKKKKSQKIFKTVRTS